MKLQVKKFSERVLRHYSSATTIDFYTQSPMAQRIAAQQSVLSAILKQPPAGRELGEAWRGSGDTYSNKASISLPARCRMVV